MRTPFISIPTLILGCVVGFAGCGDEVPDDSGSGGNGSVNGGNDPGNGSGNGRESNFGPCSWTSAGLVSASGDFVTVGPEEAGPFDEPSRVVNFNNDSLDGIVARTPARLWSGSGGSFELVCGTDFALFGNVPTQEAAGGVCIEQSQVTIEVTPTADGVWQGVLSIDEASFLRGAAAPERVEGALTLTFTGRARMPGQGAVCE